MRGEHAFRVRGGNLCAESARRVRGVTSKERKPVTLSRVLRETSDLDTDIDVPWHVGPAAQACAGLRVDPNVGLDSEEIRRRLIRFGRNELPRPPKTHPIIRVLAQFADPLVGALLVAAVVAAVVASTETNDGTGLARYGDTAAILLIVALNAGLGFFQERKAERALDALERMAAPTARVVRGGETQKVQGSELVPGDILELEAGDAVPADARLVTTSELAAEESALTGESEPVIKDAGARVDENAPVADQATMVFMGTSIARGNARALVVRTGAGTELGRIGTLIRSTTAKKTPLEVHISKLGRLILVICLALSALLFAIGWIQGTTAWTVLLLTAVSLAVAAIPEGLPAITTITLAIGMQRMAERGAIVRRLPAVETLGSATVICTDKTGTLTQNAMTVRHIETCDETFEVSGAGYGVEGEIRSAGARVSELPRTLRELLRSGVLCNTAQLARETGEKAAQVHGDPMEAALLVLGAKGGVSRADALAETEVEQVMPFDSARMLMTVITRERGGRALAHIKGAPEAVLARCAYSLTSDGLSSVDAAARQRLQERAGAHADRGLRVLAIAQKSDPETQPEDALTFLGFVVIQDPPRPEAKTAVRACQDAGIRIAMVTGDHPRTAMAIAAELDVWHDGDEVMTGAQLEALDDAALQERVAHVSVFARISPEQKLRIVRALQRRGEIVAMTGDGVNDAPALKEAHIGVAMGRQGTDVAREAADLVLADDNFATIVAAIKEGRSIFWNIQKFVFFLNSSNAGLAIAVIVGSFFDWIPALTPIQLLWINLVTNGLPALALGIDPPSERQMRERPRAPRAGIFGLREGAGVIFVGMLMAISALALFWLPEYAPQLFGGATRPEALRVARTMAFSLLAFAPLVHAFNCRSAYDSIWTLGWLSNPLLWGAVLVSGAIQLCTMAIPSLRGVFMTDPLLPMQWLVVAGLALLPLPAVELMKAVARRLLPRA